jgi:hypothetical protein
MGFVGWESGFAPPTISLRGKMVGGASAFPPYDVVFARISKKFGTNPKAVIPAMIHQPR